MYTGAIHPGFESVCPAVISRAGYSTLSSSVSSFVKGKIIPLYSSRVFVKNKWDNYYNETGDKWVTNKSYLTTENFNFE